MNKSYKSLAIKNYSHYIFSIIQLVIFIYSLISTDYIPLVFTLLGVILFSILYKLGKGVVMMESVALMYTITCLVMPAIGFLVYDYNNYLARIFVKYMPVKEDVYFSFVLPAVSIFAFAITFPIQSGTIADSGPRFMMHMDRIKSIINKDTKPAIVIIVFGAFMLYASRLLPASIKFFGDLFFFSSFAGVLYLFFSNNRKLKLILLPLFLIVLFSSALNSRMFTVIVYMGITVYSFFLIGTKASLLRKLVIFFSGIFLILVLQNAKAVYRGYFFQKTYTGNKAELFFDIVVDQFSRGEALVEKDQFFPVFVRMNQGWNISQVLRRIPAQQEFDNGTQLLRVAMASVIPRFLWPDKPEAGGKFNMQHYAGLIIIGWSTNVGPVGEAYGSFGRNGGIIYMFFLGVFIRLIYKRVFLLAIKTPLLIFWLPVLFYQVTYSAETDTLQILNSIFKTSFFIWLIYKFMPSWFGKHKIPFQRSYAAKPVLEKLNTDSVK